MRDNLSQRPRVELHRTFADYIGEVLALAGVTGGVLLLAIVWTELPGEIPRHFGFTGEPTAWSGRWSAVFPVAIALAIYVGLTLLNRAPHIFNYPWPITQQNAAIQYRLMRSMVIWLKAVCVWMLVAIVWSQARVALGDAEGVSPFLIFGFLIGIHMVLAVFLYRSYRCRDGDATKDPFATEKS
jgi:hypothetical protein